MALPTLNQDSLPWSVWIRHVWILSRWKRWLVPALCMVPYAGSIIWLLSKQLLWVAQLLLAPLVMGGILGLLTLVLARAEFRQYYRQNRRRSE